MEKKNLLNELHEVIIYFEDKNNYKVAQKLQDVFIKTAQAYQKLNPEQIDYANKILQNIPDLPKPIKDLAVPVARSMTSDKSTFDQMTKQKAVEPKKDYVWYAHQILDKKMKFIQLPSNMSIEEKNKIYNYVKKYKDAGKTINQDNLSKWNKFIGVEKDLNQKPISVYNPGMDPRATKVDPNFINKYRNY